MTKASNTVFNVKQHPSGFVQANSAFAHANAAFASANNVSPQIQPAFDRANSAALYANGAFDKANSAGLYANGAFIQANAAYTKANLGAQYDANTNSTGIFALPVGTTAQRPSNAANGHVRINSSLNRFETYYKNAWLKLASIGLGESAETAASTVNAIVGGSEIGVTPKEVALNSSDHCPTVIPLT